MILTVYGLYDIVDSAIATISWHRNDNSARRFVGGQLSKSNLNLNDFRLIKICSIEDTTGEVVENYNHQTIPLVDGSDMTVMQTHSYDKE